MRASASTAMRSLARTARLASTTTSRTLRPSTRTQQPPCLFCQYAPQSRALSSSARVFTDSQTTPAAAAAAAAAAARPVRESLIPQTLYDIFPSLGGDAIPPSGPFALDLARLKREFLALQARAHPDRAPADRKRQAEAASARINEAYRTLQNPLLRAQYVLRLRGVDVADDETAKLGEDDQELLMEVLETREVIEEAQSEEELVPLRASNEERVEASVAVLEDAFRRDDLVAAKAEAVKLRYWINIRESIDAWEMGKPVVLVH
ncbi:hypothetical protein MBLNU459_g3087t1 [Dothideomycetes sp. NU459]